MLTFETTEKVARRATFRSGYAEAKRLVLEHNDIEAAIALLKTVRPRSKSNLWQWTDFMAALLLRKGKFSECCKVLTCYDARHPGDSRVMFLIRKVEAKSSQVGIRNGLA